MVRPNSEYHVAVSTQGTSVPTSVTVSLVGRQDNGRVFNAEQSLVVEPYTTRVARLEVWLHTHTSMHAYTILTYVLFTEKQ